MARKRTVGSQEPVRWHPTWQFVLVITILAVALILPPILSNKGNVTLPIPLSYPLAGAIGAFVGATEIIARYRNDPFGALAKRASLLYLAVNFIAAAAALSLVDIYVTDNATTAVLVAGFGAMAILRGSLFSVRYRDTDVPVGPAAFLQTILNAADAEVDRALAKPRAVAVERIMRGVDANKARTLLPLYCHRLLQSSLSEEDYAAMTKKINDAYDDSAVSYPTNQSKAYALGLYIMNYMGEEVLEIASATLGPEIKTDSDKATIEEVIRDYYGALRNGKFEQAYSYRVSDLVGKTDEEKEAWISGQRSSNATNATVDSVEVNGVAGTATASVNVSFGDAPRSRVTWYLVREGGQWKLKEQHAG